MICKSGLFELSHNYAPWYLVAALLLTSGCSSSDNATTTQQDDTPAIQAPSTNGGNPGPDSDNPTNDEPEGDSPANVIGNSLDTLLPNRLLSPLPNPPLTPPPGPDSEPVRATGPVSTVSEFFLVRNPVRDLQDTAVLITDAEFEAGPIPPVIYTPAHVDPTSNSAPYFDELQNVDVLAGETIEILLRPLDPDGGVPGLFPNALPAGARYVDNLNGTRSLIWRPLQPDVGIYEFTITATDPVEPFYRTEQTIRIRVRLPSDVSGIVNLPPGINEIRPHTVRVNDPVVAYIKVSDPNGTIPTLRILNPPSGAVTTPHYADEATTILSFVPRTAGIIDLQLTATDAEDSSLTTSQTVRFEVLEESSFNRPGNRLRELASARDLLFGYASLLHWYERPDGALYADIAAEEFNFVTTENSMKWDRLNPLPGVYRWASADNLISHAKARRQAVHGHTLLWHRQLPGWIKRTEAADREVHMREFIDRVLNRYADDIPVWDVVNEAIDEDGSFRQSIWYEAMGVSFIDIAFRQARESAPDAVLLYNDYDIEFAGPKATSMLQLMRALKDAGTPIDGVGFQMHLFADFDRFDEVSALFAEVAAMDLDIYITELDISIDEGQTREQQAAAYRQALSVCLEQARCKAFQTWGFTDMYSWRRDLQPLIMDNRYQIKPAYLSLQQRLQEN